MENPSPIITQGGAIHPWRYWQTAGYYAAFIILGLTTASFGPALPYVAEQTHTQLSQVSSLLALRSFGYLLGSFRGGRLYDQHNGHPVVASVLLLLAITLALVPAVPLLIPLAIVLFIIGLAEGSLDVGGNTLIMWVHGSRVSPFMNGLHFFFGVGAFLAPLVVAQALVMTGRYGAAYWAIALLILPVALIFMRIPSPPKPESSSLIGEKAFDRKLVILLVAFFFLYVGAESSFGSWAFTYATRQNLAGETTAAFITSAFWGALTLGRLLGVPFSAKLNANTVIWIDLVGCAISIAAILMFPGSSLAFWIGAMGLGFSMASVFPTALSLAEKRLNISGKITGWFFVGASLGGMVVTWVIGQLIEPVGPLIAIWIIFGVILACIIVFRIIEQAT